EKVENVLQNITKFPNCHFKNAIIPNNSTSQTVQMEKARAAAQGLTSAKAPCNSRPGGEKRVSTRISSICIERLTAVEYRKHSSQCCVLHGDDATLWDTVV